jgi:hypothetical protein
MSQRLKSWESPRHQGRNNKGKGGAARFRQVKKQQQTLRKLLKAQNTQKNENHGSHFSFLSTYTKLIVYFMIRLMGRMPFAPTQTKMRLIGRMPIHGANAIRPYGRNSTGSGGFRATRTLRKRLCRSRFQPPGLLILR